MDKSILKQECVKLMETADVMYLSTVGADGFPHTRAMANLRNKQQCRMAETLFKGHSEDFLVYMLTGDSMPKMRQIRANPKISVYYCIPDGLHTLMLAGLAEEIADLKLKKRLWQGEWAQHWPSGPEDSEFVLLKMLPTFAKGFYKDKPFEFSL